MLFRHQGSTQIHNQEDDFQLSFAARQLSARTMDKRYEDIHDKSTSLNKAIIELIRRDKKFCGQKDALGKENANLKALFENHNLPWPTENGFSTVTGFDVPNAESTLHSKLPPELQHRILGFILQLSKPIIDAGVKILKCNVTESEHAEQQYIPVQFLRLRIVGRYYDDGINDHSLLGYDSLGNQLKINNMKRCLSLNIRYTGLQSYCWRQIFDFLEALQFPNEPEQLVKSEERNMAFDLKSMMIDLANFGDELPAPGIALRKLTRGKLGPILDENFAKTQLESAEGQKYVWKQLSKAFAGFEGDNVQFRVGSGFAVGVSEGTERAMIHDESRELLDEFMAKGVVANHDEDLADDILEDIYGPISDNGDGRLLQESWGNSGVTVTKLFCIIHKSIKPSFFPPFRLTNNNHNHNIINSEKCLLGCGSSFPNTLGKLQSPRASQQNENTEESSSLRQTNSPSDTPTRHGNSNTLGGQIVDTVLSLVQDESAPDTPLNAKSNNTREKLDEAVIPPTKKEPEETAQEDVTAINTNDDDYRKNPKSTKKSPSDGSFAIPPPRHGRNKGRQLAEETKTAEPLAHIEPMEEAPARTTRGRGRTSKTKKEEVVIHSEAPSQIPHAESDSLGEEHIEQMDESPSSIPDEETSGQKVDSIGAVAESSLDDESSVEPQKHSGVNSRRILPKAKKPADTPEPVMETLPVGNKRRRNIPESSTETEGAQIETAGNESSKRRKLAPKPEGMGIPPRQRRCRQRKKERQQGEQAAEREVVSQAKDERKKAMARERVRRHRENQRQKRGPEIEAKMGDRQRLREEARQRDRELIASGSRKSAAAASENDLWSFVPRYYPIPSTLSNNHIPMPTTHDVPARILQYPQRTSDRFDNYSSKNCHTIFTLALPCAIHPLLMYRMRVDAFYITITVPKSSFHQDSLEIPRYVTLIRYQSPATYHITPNPPMFIQYSTPTQTADARSTRRLPPFSILAKSQASNSGLSSHELDDWDLISWQLDLVM
ncbi:hypothetical protein EYC84_003716 [Monilinia fructicola]|uniref:Uncharacterized protein n=1 Tax=Monilinia fructicola TaxID=38448 RepID=A0A5M9JUL2_MONFR|nr:hypothetical protein EYC84_003716 [Monilinia fructicola]